MEPKTKRIRLNPTKRWTVAEEMSLIDYLLENRDFEKPTAQKYYNRFREEYHIPVEWKQVCAKVRNMRLSFHKAKAWADSTEAHHLDEESLKDNLINMFSYFYEFDEIFGTKLDHSAVIEESLRFTKLWDGDDCESVIDEGADSIEEFDIIEEADNIDDLVSIEDDQIILQSPIKIEKHTDVKCFTNTNQKTTHTTRTTMSDIMKIQSELLSMKKQKLCQDIAATEKFLSIREREVALKERELELKQRQHLSQRKLKILELEMKERLAKEELKLKYKCEL